LAELAEVIVVGLAMASLAAFVALVFWLRTGLSPRPLLVLTEMAGFGTGIAVLSLIAPRHRR